MNAQFERNLGVLSPEDMNKLKESRIAIAGCGCIGGFSAELLTRLGIGALRIADPDIFDVTNINRQCAATHETVGMPKVDAMRKHLQAIQPEINLDMWNESVMESNADAFVADADYVVDAIDYFAFPHAVALHRAARRHGKPVITAAALGFGTSVLAFHPQGMTLEAYVGIDESTPLHELEGAVIPASRYATHLPSYVTAEQIKAWLQSRHIPTISVGQALGPGVLVSKLVLHLLGRQEPQYVPDSFQLQLEA
ncbi:ThiF family adenylyltransferase [Xylanibacillus composti]|uniref:THIF-type NAD/FAD binding fold domain-containing protein n=1 Tax=Xylanibacillus composti TaxID=1572762 RepID=A0A8J4M154_9BACL|nr:ThiF family adenylyltransferase [Xylanibacillus composti]GIQ67745.1 hypothetical protein XYCOK13_05690 [Xylanibacillus composti]